MSNNLSFSSAFGYLARFRTVVVLLIGMSVFPVHYSFQASSQNQIKSFVLSGSVKDASTGESLIGATIFIPELPAGGVTNNYGFYSITARGGIYDVRFAFLGYSEEVVKVDLSANKVVNVNLKPSAAALGEVVVEAKAGGDVLRTPGMGMQQIQSRTIKNVPVLMGETDLVKVIQLMPGVMPASEGSSGFSVRGGNPDQNLILLDEAAVYNAGHLMGFFSVFNNDAVKDVKLYKGDIPAAYGGRLASLLDVRMKDGNNQKLSGTGGVGTISSRLTLEGPIGSDRTSFIVSGRRTYADLLLGLSQDEEINKSSLYFYDFNAKLTHAINDNNRIYASGYLGRDVMSHEKNAIKYGNRTFSLRWNHVFSPKLFSNTMLLYSHYNYYLESNHDDANRVSWKSDLYDFGFKSDFSWYMNPQSSIDFGGQLLYHKISPGVVKGLGANALVERLEMPLSYSLESSLYVSNNLALTSWMNVRYGMRFSMFQNMGASEQYYYDDNHEFSHSVEYGSNEVFNTYINWEPRITGSFALSNWSSIKAGYVRSVQYIHQATNSTSGSPLDVWFVSSPNVKPQVSDQYSAGFFTRISHNKVEASLEFFYKKMDNSIDFRDHASLLLNKYLEGELRFGRTYAYGAELMVRLDLGRINGWVGYTLSKSERKFAEINDGTVYLSPYDHPHDISLVLNGKVSGLTMVSANWVFYTGNPATFPVGRYEVGGNIVPLYSKRNSDRMPDYHRLDLSCTIEGKKKEGRKWSGEWVFSLYNAYGRKNAWSINFEKDKDDSFLIRAQKVYLFSFVPSIAYNFKF
jgi:hypothetical protein